MNSGKIRAGEAFVELSLRKGKLDAGLRKVGGQLRAFGAGVKAIGLKIFALGAAMKAPFTAAEGIFASMGTEMARMSAKTGVSVEALSQLGYAAKENGVELEGLGNGLRKMQNKLGEAEQGNTAAIMSFGKLRISIAQLKSMSPDKQFELVADRLSQLRDPAQRAAMAIELFGKSGTELLPLLNQGGAGIEALRKKADQLGLTMSGKDAAAAEELTKTMSTLKDVVMQAAFNVGGALAPTLKDITGKITHVATRVSNWIKSNRGVIESVAKVATVVLASGAAIYALGAAFGYAGSAVKVLATVLGFVSNPFLLIGAAVGVAVFAFVKFTKAGQAMWQQVKAFLAPIVDTFQRTFAGIKDAISAGNLELAAKIAMTGVRVAMLQGVSQLADSVGGDLGDFIGSLGAQFADGNLVGVWNTVLSGLHLTFSAFSQSIVRLFATACRGVMHLWTGLLNAMSDYLVHDAAHGGWLSKMLPGKDGDPDLATTIRRKKSESDKKYLEDLNAFNAENVERKKHGLPDKEMPLDLALRKSEHEGGSDADAFEERYKARVRELNAGTTKGADSFLDDLEDAADKNNDQARAAFNKQIGGGKGRFADHHALEAAQAELKRLQGEAAKGAADDGGREDPNIGKVQAGAFAALSSMKTSVAGTFNAMTAGRQLGGFNPIVDHIKQTNIILNRLTQEVRNGGAAGFFC